MDDDKPKLKLLNAGLNQIGNEIIAHGWIDIDSLGLLKVDDYQREELGKIGKKTALQSAVEKGAALPDIMLGMRGQRFTSSGKSMFLEDPVFIIDGLQRVCALKMADDALNGKSPTRLIGAEVRFGTTKESEKDLFIALNTSRVPVSPNVILRNMRDNHKGILTLYGLSNADKEFPLYHRVSWNQRMKRGELVTALMMAKVTIGLHQPASSTRAATIASSIDTVAERIQLATLRENVKSFFTVLEECWGISGVEYGTPSTHLRGNFMETLAKVFRTHSDFWKKENLYVVSDLRKRLKNFPISDPEVVRLSAAGNMAQHILFNMIVSHMNYGKHKKNYLKPRQEVVE